MTLVAIVAAVFIPTATSEAAGADHEPHLHERRAGHRSRRHHHRGMSTH